MILDTSAILAVLLREAEAEIFVKLIGNAQKVGVAGPSVVEAGVVLGSRLGFKSPLLRYFLHEAEVSIIPFGEPHWSVAVAAYATYGKGRHPASLNYGDCLSYAAAKLTQQPLLYKGNDFNQTDLEVVSY